MAVSCLGELGRGAWVPTASVGKELVSGSERAPNLQSADAALSGCPNQVPSVALLGEWRLEFFGPFFSGWVFGRKIRHQAEKTSFNQQRLAVVMAALRDFSPVIVGNTSLTRRLCLLSIGYRL